MERFLAIDVGAGTMDVLYYDTAQGLHYKAVVKSPVQLVAEKAARLQGDILVTGCEMGGGRLGAVLRCKAAEARVAMTPSAAATISHDPDKVRDWGIELVDEDEAERLAGRPEFNRLELADIDQERIRRIIGGFGVPYSFDCVAACAQDHGAAPPGVSHLDFRHNLFREALDRHPAPQALLHRAGEVPTALNRLRSLAASAAALPVRGEVYVMDSGMAAILGASRDRSLAGLRRCLVLDVATSHTVAAAIEDGELAAFFEYHTSDITLERLESLLQDLPAGRLTHAAILKEGGHGAYSRRSFPFDAVEGIVATGPRRALLDGTRLPVIFGAPFGDNMMTGCGGLLEAVRLRAGLKPFSIS